MPTTGSRSDIYAETLAVFERLDDSVEPLTTPEVAAVLDAPRRTIYKRLRKLVDRGDLKTKEVGANARVWWQPPDPATPYQSSLELPGRDHLYNVIFNRTFEFIGLLEPDGTLIEANDAALTFGGLNRSDVIGNPFWEAHWWQISEQAQSQLKDAITKAADGEFVRYEVEVQGDERTAVIDFSLRPVTNDAGEVTLLVPEGRDITERQEMEKELRESGERLSAFVTATSEVVYRMTSDWSEMYELDGRGFVVDTDEPRQNWLDEYIPTDERPRVTEAIETAIETKSMFELEHRVTQLDGSLGWTHSRAVPILDDDGEIVEWFGTATDITERKQALQQLQRVDRLNTVIRAIVRTVARADTRDEIAQTVCKTLLEFDTYQATVMGEFSPSFDDFESWAMTGNIEAVLEGLREEAAPPLRQTVAAKAVRSGEFHVREALSDVPHDYWRQLASDHRIQSFAAIPLVFQESTFGVLVVYANRPQAFDPEKQRILMELGEIIGYALYALERKEVLNPRIELRFQSARIAEAFRAETDGVIGLTLDSVVPLSDGTQRQFWTVNGLPPRSVQTVITDNYPVFTDVKLLRTVGETARLQVTATEQSTAAIFGTFDGDLRSVTIKGDTARLIGRFPESVDPTAVTRALREPHPDIELVAQRRILTPSHLRELVEEQLTDRQQTVLRLAYFGGYYDDPRLSTGDELAAELEISRQTFHHHLRKAEDTVFYHLLERGTTPG